MSDPLDVTAIVTHPATTGILGASGVGALMRWLQGKEAASVSTKLALMEQKLDQLVASSTLRAKDGERIALLEQAVRNINDRIDALVTPPPSIERRRR